METKATLIRAKSRVELNTIAAVDADLTLVVLPGYTELDNSLGNGADL
jgi:hypothetical protein